LEKELEKVLDPSRDSCSVNLPTTAGDEKMDKRLPQFAAVKDTVTGQADPREEG
jgi:hypothetical protein